MKESSALITQTVVHSVKETSALITQTVVHWVKETSALITQPRCTGVSMKTTLRLVNTDAVSKMRY